MNERIARCVFLLSFFCFFVSAVLPGFQGSLSQAAVTYIKDVGLPILVKELQSISVPDISGDVDTPVGKIEYTLSHIKILGLSIPANQVSLTITSSGLTASLSSMYAKGSLDWHYREKDWPHVSDSGTADIELKDTSGSLSLAVTANNQRPYLSVLSSSVHIGDLDIHLHGGASWLYQIFVDVFSSEIKHSAESALNDAIKNEVNQEANKALASLPISVEVTPGVEIDYGLLSNPSFTPNTRLVTFDVGKFYAKAHPSDESPFSPSAMPQSLTSEMLQVFVSSYFANTAGWTYYRLGLMQYLVTQKDLPSGFPFALNTSSFCDFLPKLCKDYPDAAMTIYLNETQTPLLKISPQMVLIQLFGDAVFNVILPNKTSTPVFGLNITAYLTGNASIVNGNYLAGIVDYLKSDFAVEFTRVGIIPAKMLTDLVNSILKNYVVPMINSKIEKGTPLPTVDGVSFVNPKIGYGNDFVYVSTDIKYTPTFGSEEVTMLSVVD